MQSVHDAALGLDHVPAAQTRHLSIALCSAALTPGSVRNVPLMQLVHDEALALDHVPAAQVAHATVETGDAVPATQAVQDAPPGLASVSVIEPAVQSTHRLIVLWAAALVPSSMR
jgi:hypothetical protein